VAIFLNNHAFQSTHPHWARLEKDAAFAGAELSAEKIVDLPTLGNPTMPQLRAMRYYRMNWGEGQLFVQRVSIR